MANQLLPFSFAQHIQSACMHATKHRLNRCGINGSPWEFYFSLVTDALIARWQGTQVRRSLPGFEPWCCTGRVPLSLVCNSADKSAATKEASAWEVPACFPGFGGPLLYDEVKERSLPLFEPIPYKQPR